MEVKLREIHTPARVGLAAVALTLAGCGGGGSALPATSPATPNSVAPAAPNSAGRNVAVSVHIPGGAPASATTRSPKYVAASTQGLVVNVTPLGGSTLTTYADVSSNSKLCVAASGGGRNCTIGIAATPGILDTFTAQAFDQVPQGAANGYGTGMPPNAKLVAETTGSAVSVTPVASVLSQVALHLQPILASVAPAGAHAIIVMGGPNVQPTQTEFTVQLSPQDVDGNMIASGSGDSFITSSGGTAQAQAVGAATGNAILVGLSATNFGTPGTGALTTQWEYSQGQSGTPFDPLTPSFINVGIGTGTGTTQTDQIEIDPLWVDNQTITVAKGGPNATFNMYLGANTGSQPSIPAINANPNGHCTDASGNLIAKLSAPPGNVAPPPPPPPGGAAAPPASALPPNTASTVVTIAPQNTGTCTFSWTGTVKTKQGETVTGTGPAVTITVQ